MPVDHESQIVSATREFQYLAAWSAGVVMEIKDFDFLDPIPTGLPKFAALDILNNMGEATLSQRVHHVTRFYERVAVTVVDTHIESTTDSMKLDIRVLKRTHTVTHEYRKETTTEVVSEQEIDIEVSMEVYKFYLFF